MKVIYHSIFTMKSYRGYETEPLKGFISFIWSL